MLLVLGLLAVILAAVIRLRGGDRERSLARMKTEELAALAHLSPDDALVHSSLAHRLLAEKRVRAAKSEFETAVHLDPDSSRAHFGLARALALLGDPRTAESELVEAIRLDKHDAQAELALGQMLLAERRMKDAMPHLVRATELDARNDQAWYARAVCCSGTGGDPEAVDCLRHALAINEGNADFHTSMGELLARQNQTADAIRHYERAIQIDPQLGEPRAQLGKLLVTNPPDAAADKRAEEVLLRATKLRTGRPAEVWFALGQLYTRQRRTALAVDALERAVNADPRDERFYYALANAYRASGDARRAQAARAEFKRISALHVRMEHLAPLVAGNPANNRMRLDLARVYRDLRLYDLAARQYAAYLGRSPGDKGVRAELNAIIPSGMPSDQAASAPPPIP